MGNTNLFSKHLYTNSFSSSVAITEVFKHKITHNSFKITYKSLHSGLHTCIENQIPYECWSTKWQSNLNSNSLISNNLMGFWRFHLSPYLSHCLFSAFQCLLVFQPKPTEAQTIFNLTSYRDLPHSDLPRYPIPAERGFVMQDFFMLYTKSLTLHIADPTEHCTVKL